ncbi:hypothetical protein BH09GEM1_BH09GEM1_29990 [soil metagenome]
MTLPVVAARHDDPGDGNAIERLTSGNPEADYILGGGFPANSINIIMGHPGSGKTIFAEQLIFANAGDDRPILYLTTLSEPLPKVVRYLQGFSFYDEEKLGTQVIFEDVGTELAEHGPDALVPRLREAIMTLSPKVIVIDSFNAVHDLVSSSLQQRPPGQPSPVGCLHVAHHWRRRTLGGGHRAGLRGAPASIAGWVASTVRRERDTQLSPL